jgi:hypothetical protein
MARTRRVQKTAHPVDGDVEFLALVDRYKQLRVYLQQAAAEQDTIKDKLISRMDEHGVQSLTVKDIPVVSLSEYPQDYVDTKAFKAAHPRIYTRFLKIVQVRKVNVP